MLRSRDSEALEELLWPQSDVRTPLVSEVQEKTVDDNPRDTADIEVKDEKDSPATETPGKHVIFREPLGKHLLILSSAEEVYFDSERGYSSEPEQNSRRGNCFDSPRQDAMLQRPASSDFERRLRRQLKNESFIDFMLKLDQTRDNVVQNVLDFKDDTVYFPTEALFDLLKLCDDQYGKIAEIENEEIRDIYLPRLNNQVRSLFRFSRSVLKLAGVPEYNPEAKADTRLVLHGISKNYITETRENLPDSFFWNVFERAMCCFGIVLVGAVTGFFLGGPVSAFLGSTAGLNLAASLIGAGVGLAAAGAGCGFYHIRQAGNDRILKIEDRIKEASLRFPGKVRVI